MQGISSPGVKLHGAGFIVTPEQAAVLLPLPLGEGGGEGQRHLIRPYRNGRDLTDTPRGALVIDAFGLGSDELRDQHPAVWQWLHERVKPERNANNRASYRDNWWLFGEPRKDLRPALAGLPRYIATVETAKHRTFQFLDAAILPDNMLIAIALDDAYALGVLSSQVHIDWALATGGTLEDRPRYNKTRCFETFPFPDEDTGLTAPLRQRIAQLAEQIDAHRKRVLGHDTFPSGGRQGWGPAAPAPTSSLRQRPHPNPPPAGEGATAGAREIDPDRPVQRAGRLARGPRADGQGKGHPHPGPGRRAARATRRAGRRRARRLRPATCRRHRGRAGPAGAAQRPARPGRSRRPRALAAPGVPES
ncbi:type IIL restriction-modification enzyme MmeI [Ottowia pentelensis]|uniref:type IIL restriction-modification enzyme MmeI n=1 Tax=Ottowia pentelensis TaxID=511108 RepID=UPI003644C736